ncbi:hypothetical protein [uncultured Tessaracoccus sp.]|uniref:hypothetical protein n=1 Tax=uncultured Tessaracoccus sp. TaxID=905023 RepID=UPI0025FCC6F1|nr:hypothetical protein [uncultured Tessaracoccus sp.]
MTKPTVDSELETRLDALINEGHDARDAGDPAAAVARWEQAWELLPDPKLEWDYYGQALTLDLTKACLEAGDVARAATWCERLDEAYAPHDETSRMLVDFEKAKLLFRGGQPDLAHAYFDAIYKVKGKRVFDGESPDYYEFYQSWTPARRAKPASTQAGWELEIPAPGTGAPQTALDDATHAAVVERLDEGDNYLDLDAPQAAAEQYVAGLRLLPEPRTQWEHATMLYTALTDACLALTQYAEAEQAARYAMETEQGRGNGYVWLRLGDALRGQGRDADALEAYTSAWMTEGDELFEGEDDALAMLDAAGVRKG